MEVVSFNYLGTVLANMERWKERERAVKDTVITCKGYESDESDEMCPWR